MLRQVQRTFKRVRRRISDTRFPTPNFLRSYSSRPYYTSTVLSRSVIASDSDRDDDDDAFEPPPTTPESPVDEGRRPSFTIIPCEFCQVPQSSTGFMRHQSACRQNPNRTRGRNTASNTIGQGRRRRAVSDNITVLASAPPRTRSPSPTEGFDPPEHLNCPITGVLFRDPVVANDGHTYEREAILRWVRSVRKSPVTREPLTSQQIFSNRVVKKMVDDFREECKRKKFLKYKLDVDVMKTEQTPFFQNSTKSIYHAKWLKTNSKHIDSKIVLVHLTGEHAEKIAESISRLKFHPNILQVFGRVEHNGTGVLLVQEYLSTQTVSQLLENKKKKLSMLNVDLILYQIVSGLQYLANNNAIYDNITTDNVLIYHMDEVLENTLIKFNNIGCAEDHIPIDEIPSDDHHSEKSIVYAIGILAREMYSLALAPEEEVSLERQGLYERCLRANSDDRLTLNELTKAIDNLIHSERRILEHSSAV